VCEEVCVPEEVCEECVCVCVCVGASSQGKRVPAVFTPLAFGCHYFTKYAI
jgi:hypothetical protein